MIDDSNPIRAKHLEALSSATKRFLLSQVLTVTDAVQSELDDLSGTTLDTTQPTVDGALWYQLLDDGLQLCLHYGGHDYSFDGETAAPQMICEFSSPNEPYNSIAVTVLSNRADFGVQENDSPQGAELYTVLTSITCTQDNSTIIGNAKPNSITICGGENNSLIGGINNDQYYFASGGGTIGDFGIVGGFLTGNGKNIAGKFFAVNVTQKASSQYLAYDRTDPNSYNRGADTLQVNGTVTAVAVPYYSADNSVTQALAHFDATVYYVDELNKTHSILLADVLKPPVLFSHYYAHNHATYGAPSLKIYDMSSGSMASIAPTDFIYDPNA